MKQKEKKRIVSKLFAALVVLTLISCCFLGSTFARYTSTGEGTASVQVAKWDIDITGGAAEGSTDIAFDKLSPNVNSAGDMSENHTNTTARKQIVSIINKGDVDATVTINLGDIALKDINNAWYSQATSSDTAPSAAEAAAVFSITFYTQATGGSSIDFDEDGNYTTTLYATGSTEGNSGITLYAEVTWTTYYDNTTGSAISNTWKGVNADKLDTWIGEHIASVHWTLSYTAVQGSQLPKAGN